VARAEGCLAKSCVWSPPGSDFPPHHISQQSPPPHAPPPSPASAEEEESTTAKVGQQTAGHISTTAASFRDFLLKPEILRAINDCAFEHPSKGK